MAIPNPQEQIDFFQKVQRLLTEGRFVASYKFALLLALADLAVLKGDDEGTELTLSIREIAEVMIELYWRQTRPFVGIGETYRLKQNTGKQAGILNEIGALQDTYEGSLTQLRHDHDTWPGLVGEVARIVRDMPLWKLQKVGNEVMDFLYPNVERGTTICLHPGVAFCLRRFYGILRNLIEGAWINYVRNVNAEALGHPADLGNFLFGSDRSSLETYRPILCDLQAGECFYCHRPLKDAGEVDHFIPWSRYPVDLGHNFVLAHGTCNAAKSDNLAAEDHLARWIERNERDSSMLSAKLADARLPHDLRASRNIAHWAYQQTSLVQGKVWVQGKHLAHLGSRWQSLLVHALESETHASNIRVAQPTPL